MKMGESMNPRNAGTPTGFATRGRPFASSVGVGSRAVPTV
jgi:hypothetical protein